MKKFQKNRPLQNIVFQAMQMGWDVDLSDREKECIWLRDLENRMLRVSYNTTNGNFNVFTPFSNDKPVATDESKHFEGYQWYNDLLTLFYEDIIIPNAVYVFEINGHVIAAENPNSAFSYFIEESEPFEDISIGELGEGDIETVVISIKRLSQQQIDRKDVPCCDDGCELCDELNDKVYTSYRELISKEIRFPSVIAKEF
jgi:hypothetical protein